VSDDRTHHEEPYEPPRIEDRADIGLPLIGGSGAFPCAAFADN
jgi:hypothetical protein